jgi:predicted phosphate transport protein (TIGR00153 family)
MPLIPRDEKYFEQLNDLMTRIHKGAELLVQLLDDVPNKARYLKSIKDIEHECDRISKGIIERLNSSFITPIDREDIYLLATELDDVMDRINDIALLTVLHGIKEASPAGQKMARILMDAVLELEPAVAALQSRKEVRAHIEKVKAIEEEGDRVWQETVQRLFEEETNAVELIRWMGIYDKMEAAIDRCNDVAKALEGIVVKNA